MYQKNKVSIVMLVHNAPYYTYRSIKTIKNTINVDYELIVVDNASRLWTKLILKYLKMRNLIDKLITNRSNKLFAEGNNIGVRNASKDSDLVLLINSDVRITNPLWLKRLIEIHPDGGVSSYGAVLNEPKRADGYCFLVDRKIYDKYQLDEEFQWWWSITKLQSQILKDGNRIVCVKDHENAIHHYGGRSGKGFKNAKGMGVDIEEIKKWFTTGDVEVINCIDF